MLELNIMENMPIMDKKYALLDDEGNVVRWFDYPAEGTVKIKEPEYKIDWDNFVEAPF